jgi:hypothetical protein
LRHGYFTYYLLQALKANKGMDPMSAVYATVAKQVSDRVAADAKADGQNVGQHPVMSRSSDESDFALGITTADGAARGGR